MARIQTSAIASQKPALADMTRKIRSVALTRNLPAGIAVIMLAAASAAGAADISAQRAPMPMAFVAPPFSWTGFYVGANLGGGWASSTLSDSFTGASLGNSSSGFVGGGQLGYNYQIGNFVVGPEWTFEGTSLNGSRTVGGLHGTANTNWMTTIAARFGVAENNWLFYGKAGGGWTNNSGTLTNLNNGTQVSSSNTNGGWLLGAGIEYAFAPQWSARLEYDYLKLNTWSVNSNLFAPNTDRFSVSRNIQTVLVGVNYRF
jgi:outer membrane immunogenic protein